MRGIAPTERGVRKRLKHKICSRSGKRAFNTRKKALRAPAPIGQSWSAYRCGFCGEWHATTQERTKR